MPSYLTHRIAGESVSKGIRGGALKKLLDDNIKVFRLGCQGGDIFFYYRYLFGRKAWDAIRFGSLLHSKHIKTFFKESLKYINGYRGEGKEALIAYFFGYILHYCTDKNVHPFVYKKTGTDINHHHRLEHMLDAMYTREKWGKEARTFDIYGDVYFGDMPDAIGKWYARMAKDVYLIDLPDSVPNTAYTHMAKIKRRFTQPGVFSRTLFRLYNIILPVDLFSMVYLEPGDFDYYTDADYLYLKKQLDLAVAETKGKISAAFKYFNGERTLDEVTERFEDINFAGEPSQNSPGNAE